MFFYNSKKEVVGVDTNPEVITSVNKFTELRFQLEVERNAENQRFAAAKAALESEHTAKLSEFAERERKLDPTIWQTIDDNRTALIARGKESFVTMVAKFQFRKVPAKTEITDKDAIMAMARQRGHVRQIANPPKGDWRFNQKKFLAFLAKNGEQRRYYEDFLDDVPEGKSLTAQPNTNYTVEHDSKRISPPSISIKKSSPRDNE